MSTVVSPNGCVPDAENETSLTLIHFAGYWMFGEMWCNIHSAMDVLTCTASIMNICLISLDRYWSITKAVDYLTQRTPLRVMLMIFTVWVLSGLISIPPLLGWKVPKGSSSHVAK